MWILDYAHCFHLLKIAETNTTTGKRACIPGGALQQNEFLRYSQGVVRESCKHEDTGEKQINGKGSTVIIQGMKRQGDFFIMTELPCLVKMENFRILPHATCLSEVIQPSFISFAMEKQSHI